MQIVRILVVGDGHSPIHEVAVCKAFAALGHEVSVFFWVKYFTSKNPILRFLQRIQNKLLLGPTLCKLNSDILFSVYEFEPDIVFIYRGTHVYLQTIGTIKDAFPDCIICGYNNDDPFAGGHSIFLWRHFLKATPKYDLMFAYRHHNLRDFRLIGARHVELLRSWYLPETNCVVELDDADREGFECDVVFVGHYENDGRLQFFEEIARNGFKLRLFGPPNEWNHLLRKSKFLRHLEPARMVWGEEYNKALCGAKIALCFFSKLNRDTYTRRCFEIPATGTFMLSEYSDDVASLYQEGVDADYFRNKEELIQKVTYYIKNETTRLQVAANGRKRVVEDGHDIVSRMKMVLERISLLQSKSEN